MKISKKYHKHPTRELVDDHIQEILSYFDFNSIHTMMASVNWTWFSIGRVPTADEIKAEAEKRLFEATEDLTKQSYEISCGGLTARYSLHSDEDGNYFMLRLYWGIECSLDGVGY